MRLASAAFALALLAGCHAEEAAKAEAKPAVQGESIVFPAGSPQLSRISIEKVENPFDAERTIPGRMAWDEERTVRVFTPFAGRVTRLIARPGDRVAAGAPLAEVMSSDFGQARSDARRAQADLDMATKSLARQRELHANGVTAAKDLQQAETDHTRARAEADRALGRLSSYGQALDANSFVLKSPIAGTVVERTLNPGQELRPDQPGAPLFVVTDPTRLWVILDANESDLRALKVGMPLVVTSNQFPEDAFAGQLAQLSDSVDPTARTVKLRGIVPNPERTLKAEMFVAARVRLPKGADPIVNAKAVYSQGARRFVFVRTLGNTFTRRPVRIGPEFEGRVPVHSGLAAGEEVAVNGNLFLQQMISSARPPEKS